MAIEVHRRRNHRSRARRISDGAAAGDPLRVGAGDPDRHEDVAGVHRQAQLDGSGGRTAQAHHARSLEGSGRVHRGPRWAGGHAGGRLAGAERPDPARGSARGPNLFRAMNSTLGKWRLARGPQIGSRLSGRSRAGPPGRAGPRIAPVALYGAVSLAACKAGSLPTMRQIGRREPLRAFTPRVCAVWLCGLAARSQG